MNIYEIISLEAVDKFDDTRLAYKYYRNVISHLEEQAKIGYKVLCEYFNGTSSRTGLCVVSEKRAIEVLGLTWHEGNRVLSMMYELNLTERQNGMIVI